jgi:FlaA1/EpsC-like NDP-sugar epimerase
MGKGGELFVLKMGEPLRIVQLAEDLIRLSGLTPDEVPIVFTGLRPGEKLTESLWDEGAMVEATEHPEVLRVTEPQPPAAARMTEVVAFLANAARAGDRQLIDAGLAEIVPAFAGGYGRAHRLEESS